MRFLKPTIYSLIIFLGVSLADKASAVTEFKSTVKPSGGDYSTLATAENGLDYTGTCDLTSLSYLTAAYDGATEY